MPRRIARPKNPPRAAARMVLSGGPELPEAAATAVCVGVVVAAAGGIALVEVATDLDVEELEVAVAEEADEEDSVESKRICASFELASSQLFCLALYMHSTSSGFPPAITTVLSDP